MAVVSAIYLTIYHEADADGNEADNMVMRFLQGNLGVGNSEQYPQEIPTVESESVTSVENVEIHHENVYNEEHDPLFPLTSSDWIGFFLATCGLMVAGRRNWWWWYLGPDIHSCYGIFT